MKVRASALGNIMATDSKDRITANQLVTLNGLLEKQQLTVPQTKKRDELVSKRDAKPALSTGGKSYIEKLAFEDKYGITNHIENKFLDKGIFMESQAIELSASQLGWLDFEVDCEYVENEFICGTPDVIGVDWIADIKCAWSIDTFFKHLFETRITNSTYYWQLQAYMYLCDKKVAHLVYCLMNTPEHLFQKELENTKWRTRDNMDVIDLPADIEEAIYDELYNKHHFDFMDESKRIKSFKVEANESDQRLIREKVGLARKYYKQTIETI